LEDFSQNRLEIMCEEKVLDGPNVVFFGHFDSLLGFILKTRWRLITGTKEYYFCEERQEP
jgi:hypothetical protein